MCIRDRRKVKSNWGYEAVISRSASGEIVGAMGVLIQKIPLIGTSFLYAPRGPVCDLHNKAILLDLKNGADELARRYNAHAIKSVSYTHLAALLRRMVLSVFPFTWHKSVFW